MTQPTESGRTLHDEVWVTGGSIVDGSGDRPYRADVAIREGRIAAIGRQPRRRGIQSIDARGLLVTPGFIDMHSHSDLQIRVSAHGSRLLQGITTEVLGQDGLSVAPVTTDIKPLIAAQVEAWNGSSVPGWGWSTVEEYLAWLDESVSVNAAFLVPHGNLRLIACGNRPSPAHPMEIDAMCAALSRSLAGGAVGLSAGLTYVPGAFATTAELVALCEVVADAGGYFCPHHRNYGANVLQGYSECIEISRRSGVRLHLAHTHLSFERNRDLLPGLLRLFEEAIQSGVDLSFDSYPYLAGMTSLHALMPSWALAGTVDEQLGRLDDREIRDRIRRELDIAGSDGNQGIPVDWSTVRIAGSGGTDQAIVGRTVVELAASRAREPSEAFLDIVAESRMRATCTLHFGIEEHVRALMRHPNHTVGTDGILVGEAPHPRGWGAFARVLGQYVENGTIELEEAVRHMTSAPAKVLGLADRGRVEIGAAADIVVFDASRIRDLATYDDPRRSPAGIRHVFVNGQVAVSEGALTFVRAGRVLRAVPEFPIAAAG